MEVGIFKGILRGSMFLIAVITSIFSAAAYSQTMQVTVTGPETFQIQVSNVYNWRVERRVNNVWNTFVTGGSSGLSASYTLPAGTHYFRLYNCYPVSNGCSTSSTKTITLAGAVPATPTISSVIGSSSITLNWTASVGAAYYNFTRDGAPVTTSGTSYTDPLAVPGTTYSYGVKACNANGNCSGTANISAVLPLPQTQTVSYTYDALGRLTFVSDTVNGNRDYDYDNAGNRLLVSTNVVSDAATGPALLPAPTGLNKSLIANCAWRATWNPVPGAAKYLVIDTTGGIRYVTTTFADIGCPSNNSAANMPKSVQACDVNNICGTKANY